MNLLQLDVVWIRTIQSRSENCLVIEVIVEFILELGVYFMSLRVFLVLIGAIACGVLAGYIAPEDSSHIVIGFITGLVAFVIGLVVFPRQREGR